MAVSLRTLDDGAWISINDARAVGVSEIWPLTRSEFCDCTVSNLLVEAFYDVTVDRSVVVAGVVGQCIDCGTSGSVDRLAVGRIVDGEFHAFDPGRVQSIHEPGEATLEDHGPGANDPEQNLQKSPVPRSQGQN